MACSVLSKLRLSSSSASFSRLRSSEAETDVEATNCFSSIVVGGDKRADEEFDDTDEEEPDDCGDGDCTGEMER